VVAAVGHRQIENLVTVIDSEVCIVPTVVYGNAAQKLDAKTGDGVEVICM
jgi:S-adenosylmethionine hydrolase